MAKTTTADNQGVLKHALDSITHLIAFPEEQLHTSLLEEFATLLRDGRHGWLEVLVSYKAYQTDTNSDMMVDVFCRLMEFIHTRMQKYSSAIKQTTGGNENIDLTPNTTPLRDADGAIKNFTAELIKYVEPVCSAAHATSVLSISRFADKVARHSPNSTSTESAPTSPIAVEKCLDTATLLVEHLSYRVKQLQYTHQHQLNQKSSEVNFGGRDELSVVAGLFTFTTSLLSAVLGPLLCIASMACIPEPPAAPQQPPTPTKPSAFSKFIKSSCSGTEEYVTPAHGVCMFCSSLLGMSQSDWSTAFCPEGIERPIMIVTADTAASSDIAQSIYSVAQPLNATWCLLMRVTQLTGLMSLLTAEINDTVQKVSRVATSGDAFHSCVQSCLPVLFDNLQVATQISERCLTVIATAVTNCLLSLEEQISSITMTASDIERTSAPRSVTNPPQTVVVRTRRLSVLIMYLGERLHRAALQLMVLSTDQLSFYRSRRTAYPHTATDRDVHQRSDNFQITDPESEDICDTETHQCPKKSAITATIAACGGVAQRAMDVLAEVGVMDANPKPPHVIAVEASLSAVAKVTFAVGTLLSRIDRKDVLLSIAEDVWTLSERSSNTGAAAAAHNATTLTMGVLSRAVLCGLATRLNGSSSSPVIPTSSVASYSMAAIPVDVSTEHSPNRKCVASTSASVLLDIFSANIVKCVPLTTDHIQNGMSSPKLQVWQDSKYKLPFQEFAEVLFCAVQSLHRLSRLKQEQHASMKSSVAEQNAVDNARVVFSRLFLWGRSTAADACDAVPLLELQDNVSVNGQCCLHDFSAAVCDFVFRTAMRSKDHSTEIDDHTNRYHWARVVAASLCTLQVNTAAVQGVTTGVQMRNDLLACWPSCGGVDYMSSSTMGPEFSLFFAKFVHIFAVKLQNELESAYCNSCTPKPTSRCDEQLMTAFNIPTLIILTFTEAAAGTETGTENDTSYHPKINTSLPYLLTFMSQLPLQTLCKVEEDLMVALGELFETTLLLSANASHPRPNATESKVVQMTDSATWVERDCGAGTSFLL
eukprot:Lankesteria_metandrocarpae@DN4964_c0_g1_i5.p1